MDRDLETREVSGALQRTLFDEAMPSLCLGLVMLCAAAGLLYDSVSADRLILWAGSILVLSAVRVVLVYWARSRACRQMPIRAYSWLMAATGVVWGGIILLWSTELSLVDQLVIALVPVLAALGGLLSLGHWPPTYLGFIGAMLVAMIFSMTAIANESFARLLIPLALIATGCLYCSYRLYLQKREMLLLRLRNQQALRSKDEFLARMSHELRTPMNGVLGMVRMLGKTPLSSEQRDLVATLHQSGEEMLNLVSDLLDAASLSSHSISLSPEACDLRAVTQAVVDGCQLRLSPQMQELVLDMDAAIPDRVLLDQMRWKQVCQKLLDNAINFTERGRIDVQMTYVDGHLRMTIRDTGCGIDESQLQAVREVFHQVQGGARRRVGGIGIGLPIAQSLVDLMAGTLQIDSEPGKGTCVSVTVPLQEVPAEMAGAGTASVDSSESADRGPEPGGASSDLYVNAPVRALVAEDNPVNQLVIEAVLVDLGCDITLVENGLEALLALQASSFDIVFMDCQMPELDGFEATRQARESGCRLPIVAVTANAVAGDRERCLAAGMDDYVSKPFADEDLQRMLEKWLGAQSLQTPSAYAA